MNPWSILPSESFGIGKNGDLISFREMMQNLSMHLKKWEAILGDYGLLCLEVHSQTYWSKKVYSDTSEGFHFDALHAFSKQYLCEPEYFMAAMAENGLLANQILTGFPRNFKFTRITLGCYEKKPFAIRHISTKNAADICSLKKLDGKALEREMAEILASKNPELCFVIDTKDCSPEAAIFCSRGNDLEEGKYEVYVEAILNRDPINMDFIEAILHYVIQFMILKYDVGCLKGMALPQISSLLSSLGAKSMNNESLEENKEYYLLTEN